MTHPINCRRLTTGIVMLLAGTVPWPIHAGEKPPAESSSASARWVPFARGGYVHQLGTDLDDGGDFDVDRLFVQGGMTLPLGPRRRVSLAVGVGRDWYDFSGDAGFASLRPWGQVNQFRVSSPLNWAFDEQWTLFLIPTLRFFGENGADLDDSLNGGALAGVSYRFSDTLTLGPGIGVLSQLEDSASIFPILIIDWMITDRLSLTTGRGIGATEGPGLSLNYRVSQNWALGLGGRYESLRFRLDDSGSAPNGVGEDQSFPLFLSATYNRGRTLQISALTGLELGGEMRLEDSKGRKIEKETYDPAPFLGFTFNARF